MKETFLYVFIKLTIDKIIFENLFYMLKNEIDFIYDYSQHNIFIVSLKEVLFLL